MFHRCLATASRDTKRPKGFVVRKSAMAVPGLEDELRKAGLERCLEAAVDWCERSS